MSDNIIDLTNEFEARQAVEDYYRSTDSDLADFRAEPEMPDGVFCPISPVHILQILLTKGFGCEPR